MTQMAVKPDNLMERPGQVKAEPVQQAPAKKEEKKAAAPAGGPARNPACSDADWNALEALKAKIVQMKKDKASKADIDVAVAELKRLKGICELPAGSAPAPAKKEEKKSAAPAGPVRNPACSDADWNALEALKAKIVQMKKDKAAKAEIDAAVAELKRLKGICELPAGSTPAPVQKEEKKPAAAKMSKEDNIKAQAAAGEKKKQAAAAAKAAKKAQNEAVVEVAPVEFTYDEQRAKTIITKNMEIAKAWKAQYEKG